MACSWGFYPAGTLCDSTNMQNRPAGAATNTEHRLSRSARGLFVGSKPQIKHACPFCAQTGLFHQQCNSYLCRRCIHCCGQGSSCLTLAHHLLIYLDDASLIIGVFLHHTSILGSLLCSSLYSRQVLLSTAPSLLVEMLDGGSVPSACLPASQALQHRCALAPSWTPQGHHRGVRCV